MFFIFYFNLLYAFICFLYSFLYILYELFVSFDDSIELLSSLNKFIYINYAIFLFPINEFDLLSYFLFFLRLKKINSNIYKYTTKSEYSSTNKANTITNLFIEYEQNFLKSNKKRMPNAGKSIISRPQITMQNNLAKLIYSLYFID